MRTRSYYLTTEHIESDHLDKKTKSNNGAFYTPATLSIKMAKKLELKKGDTVLDPCVGSANLLCACLDEYPDLQEEDCYGIDIDPEAIKKCFERIPHGHFQVGNCLIDDLSDENFWKKDPYDISDTYRRVSNKNCLNHLPHHPLLI
jgi:type I restriction-modification system DNA methylase subunit